MVQELYELPEGWEWTGWSDTLEIIGGKNQKNVVADDGEYPIYGSGGEMGRAKDFLCPAFTTIIGRKGTINRPLYIEEPAWNVDTAFGLASNESLDSKLLFYFCRSFNFLSLNRSTTLPSLTKRDLYTLKIPLPPLNEQKRIVAKLDALFTRIDSAITHLQQTLELSKAFFASALAEAFNPLSKFDRDLYELPEGWEWKELSELSKVQSGSGFPKKFQGITGEKFPFLKVSDMNLPGNESTITSWNNSISDEIVLEIKAKIMPKGTVIFPKIGAAIATNKKRILTIPSAFDNNVMGLKAKDNLTSDYLYWYLKSFDLSEWASSAALPSMKASTIKEHKIPLPPINEQNGIVEHLDALAERTRILETTTQEKLNDLTALKASLLDAAFKGHL